jgi:hypothetical protein
MSSRFTELTGDLLEQIQFIASTESSTATWACALNTQSSLWWDWNPFVRILIKVGSLGENAKNKKKSLQFANEIDVVLNFFDSGMKIQDFN